MNKTLSIDALKIKVAYALEQAYAGTDCPVPSPNEAISHALTGMVIDAHDGARELETCNKVDNCTAQAVVLRHVADWLAELACEVHEEGFA